MVKVNLMQVILKGGERMADFLKSITDRGSVNDGLLTFLISNEELFVIEIRNVR